jgi:hypothetical protein
MLDLDRDIRGLNSLGLGNDTARLNTRRLGLGLVSSRQQCLKPAQALPLLKSMP